MSLKRYLNNFPTYPDRNLGSKAFKELRKKRKKSNKSKGSGYKPKHRIIQTEDTRTFDQKKNYDKATLINFDNLLKLVHLMNESDKKFCMSLRDYYLKNAKLTPKQIPYYKKFIDKYIKK